jgi:hypothetical protein
LKLSAKFLKPLKFQNIMLMLLTYFVDNSVPNAVVEAGRSSTSAEASDLIGHSSSSSEEITEDTSVEAENRDLASSTNSDATKVDALEDYAQVSLVPSDIIDYFFFRASLGGGDPT